MGQCSTRPSASLLSLTPTSSASRLVGQSRRVCHDYAVPAVLFDEDRKEIARHVEAGELEFRHAVAQLKGRTEWRAHTTIFPLAEYLSRQARNADLVVVGTEPGDGQCDETRRPDICDFVMSVGRPVLLVPAGATMNGLDRVVVAWKDTREARRAIVDALPFLKIATKTTIVEIADDEELPEARSGVAEVVSWLGHHGVGADAKVTLPSRANAWQLDAIARELEADLLISSHNSAYMVSSVAWKRRRMAGSWIWRRKVRCADWWSRRCAAA